MKLRSAAAAASILFATVFLASRCEADTIYYGGSPDGVVYGASEAPWGIGDSAWLFGPNQNYTLTSVTVQVSFDPAGLYPSGSADFNVWLYSSEEIIHPGGPPGIAPDAPIAEIGENLVAPNDPGLVTAYASSVIPLPEARAGYWIVLTPANQYTAVAWDGGDDSMQVYGTPGLSAPTPEPSTVTLFALALVGGALLRKRE
jgi:hypothetical protein